jgi:hypothetical protein
MRGTTIGSKARITEVAVMAWLVLMIFAGLALLVVAGPVLEELIDRIRKPRTRPPW